MVEPVAIAGVASRSGRLPGIESTIRETVLAALADAGLESLEAIDSVVTVGSDLLDGGMVATRSGLAGSYGRTLTTVPSSAGHALGAAVTMIESGCAGNTLLVGWGEGTNFARVDGRIVQADPFYTRPLGADAASLAALQAQWLLARGRLDPPALERYVDAMTGRGKALGAAPDGAAPRWLGTTWSDGVCALVLTEADGRPESTRIADFGMSFQPYCPEPDGLDPAGWVATAKAALRSPAGLEAVEPTAVGVSGPTAMAETAALSGLLERWGWDSTDPRVNSTGGGATAFYGPATGLGAVAAAATALRADPARAIANGDVERRGPGSASTAVVIDLAGPIGQAATVIVLERQAG